MGATTLPVSAHDPQPAPSDGPASQPERPTDGPTGTPPRTLAAGDFSVPNFQEEIIWDDLDHPMVVEFAPDGRVFVAEKRGVIKVFSSLADASPSVYADISTKVHDYWDRGLLGMALDPDFVDNGRMYLSYTHDASIGGTAPRWGDGCPEPPGGTEDGCVVSGRLSVLTNGTSESVLIEDWCQQYPSHSMGDIVFDAEGALIMSSGDGANFNAPDWGQWGGDEPSTPTPQNPCGDPFNANEANDGQATGEGGGLRSQDIRTTGDPLGLSGSVIRVSPIAGAPPRTDNPRFDEEPTTNGKRIVAYGLRNPFRMAIHPATGALWIGDVGWGTWEEINTVDPDGSSVRNFGWPCREGASFEPPGWDETNMCTSLAGSAVTAPHYAYQHGSAVAGECTQSSSSISGLAFYEGGPYPDQYDNALFFTDYSRQCLWVLPATGTGGAPNPVQIAHFADLAEPVHLTIGPGGDLFYVDFGQGDDNGSIRRITYLFDNDQPTADIEASPTSGDDPLLVDFDASGSSDPNDDPLTYAWSFGDDGSAFDDSFEESPSHTYAVPGTYTARVRVNDGRGGTDTDQVTINVDNETPNASITSPAASLTWSVGEVVSFSGTGNDPDDGALPASAFDWSLIMHHCPDVCHSHPIREWHDVTAGSFAAPDHEYPSHLELRLTVTDSLGGTDTASIEIDPQTVTFQMRSSPAGLRVTAGGTTAITPFSVTVIHRSAVILGVPSGQVHDGFPNTWASWSQGGPKTQTVTASASATYTATFEGGFDDVPHGAPFRNDIAWLVREAITVGCAPALYCPNGLVTRGQMATFLSRALDLPSTSTDFFSDDESSQHEASINRLRAAGITSGCGPGRFCPNGLVTRAQMASFLSRALDLPATLSDPFSDDEASSHEASINRLAAAGITSGCGPGRFCPDGIVTRGQMAAFLRRGLGE